jgi:hypothetical protein
MARIRSLRWLLVRPLANVSQPLKPMNLSLSEIRVSVVVVVSVRLIPATLWQGEDT